MKHEAYFTCDRCGKKISDNSFRCEHEVVFYFDEPHVSIENYEELLEDAKEALETDNRADIVKVKCRGTFFNNAVSFDLCKSCSKEVYNVVVNEITDYDK